MRQILAVVLAMMFSVGGAGAQDLEDAFAAKLRGDNEVAIKIFRRLADAGDADAQFFFGEALIYELGRPGVQQDLDEALNLLRLAAEQGHLRAITSLARFYYSGDGGIVVQDYVEAVRLYRLGAEQGDQISQSNLGHMYLNGKGVDQDYAEAAIWYRLAAEQGDASSQYQLGMMYEYGSGVKQNYAEAAYWYRLSANQIPGFASVALGKLYENGGHGLEKDYVQAYKRYDITCTRTENLGCSEREEIAKIMTPQDISEAQQRSRLCTENNYTDCD